MFKLVHKNNKGFSLVELLICVAILALVVPLAGQVLYSFAGVNNNITDKWQVQTAVKLACNEFNAAKDGLTNAYQVDILYDPVIENGVNLNDDGTITWLGGVASPYVLYAEGINMDIKVEPYTYIFSSPTYRNYGTDEQEYLGELMYIRECATENTKLLLGAAGFGDVPVDISFSLATTEGIGSNSARYTDSCVHIKFTSGKEDMYPYELETNFAIVNNMRSINQKVVKNDQESLVYEQRWLKPQQPGGTPMAYPAGWTDYELNATPNSNYPTGMDVVNADNSITTRQYAHYLDSEEAIQEVLITEKFDYDVNGDGNISNDETGKHVITRPGNVLRYVSPTAQATQEDVANRKTGANIATCLTGWAMMGSSFEETVLTNLRAFRDNVLKGTTFGDWFIEQYYYVWSPFVVKNLEALKPVIKAVLIPISYVCGFVAQ